MSFITRFQSFTSLAAIAVALSPVTSIADEGEEDAGPHVLIGEANGQIGFLFEVITPDPTTGALVIPIDVFGDPLPFPLPNITGVSSVPFDVDGVGGDPERLRDLAFESPNDPGEIAELNEEGLNEIGSDSSLALFAVDLDEDFTLFLSDTNLIETTGDSLALGAPAFDAHPFFILEANELIVGQTVTGTFRLVDTAGILSDSANFDITLEVVPEPGTATLALAGVTVLLRRRRATR